MAEAEGNPNNLETFLRQCKERAKEPEFLVFGNQAADMDSIMSAFSLAFFISQPQISSFLGHDIGFAIPVINIPRDDMKLRKDSLLILEEAGISSDSLIFQG
jgi:exopolyphosphatase